jgi:hypothetical protein
MLLGREGLGEMNFRSERFLTRNIKREEIVWYENRELTHLNGWCGEIPAAGSSPPEGLAGSEVGWHTTE